MENTTQNSLQNFISQLDAKLRDTPVLLENYKENFKFKVKGESITYQFIEYLLSLNSIEFQKILSQNQKSWTDSEYKLLIWVVVKFCEKNVKTVLNLVIQFINKYTQVEEDWINISSILTFKQANQCKFKWLSALNTTIQNRPWTEEEDQYLSTIIIEQGYRFKWNDIAQEIYNRSNGRLYRHGKQYRERWNNYLNPQMKRGKFSEEEDVLLLEKALEYGPKWSRISKQLQFRTENAVKNRFKSLIYKEFKLIAKYSNVSGVEPLNSLDLSKKFDEQTTQIIKNLINQITIKLGKNKMDEEQDFDQQKALQLYNFQQQMLLSQQIIQQTYLFSLFASSQYQQILTKEQQANQCKTNSESNSPNNENKVKIEEIQTFPEKELQLSKKACLSQSDNSPKYSYSSFENISKKMNQLNINQKKQLEKLESLSNKSIEDNQDLELISQNKICGGSAKYIYETKTQNEKKRSRFYYEQSDK